MSHNMAMVASYDRIRLLEPLMVESVTLAAVGEAQSTPPLPVQLDSRAKRRRRRKQRSLEELAVRHRWD